MTVWVIEKNVFSEKSYEKMKTHFISSGIVFHEISVIPFLHEIDGAEPVIENDNVVVYGSIGCQKLSERKSWFPGVWTGDGLSEDVVNSNLGVNYLNNDMIKIKLAEVSSHFNVEDEVFIKPISDTKEFAGFVTSVADIDLWVDRMVKMGYVEGNISDLDVAVSSPKHIGCEWRFVIVDGKISSFSCYKQYGIVKPKRWTTNEAVGFVEECIKMHNPYDVYVVDVCQMYDGSYKVIEYNTFNSAGFYECDVEKIIDDINLMLENKKV